MNVDLNIFRKQYEEDLMTFRELASYYSVSPSTIRCFAYKNGIKVRETGNIKEKEYHLVSPMKQEVKDVELLKDLFNKCVSVREISKQLGVCDRAVQRKVKELGLERPKSMKSRIQYDCTYDKKIIELYEEGKSSTEIGKIVGMSHRSVLNHLQHCGISRRTLSESQFSHNNKSFPDELKSFETLYDMYVENRMSKKEIGLLLNVDPSTVNRALKSFGIHVRNNSETKKGMIVGPNHPNWKGGRTGLYMRLRTYFRVNQVKEVIKRDGKKCTLCGGKKKLQVHHIKPFKEIFNEILLEHPDLDVLKDKEELYNIMVKDERMNNLDNLVTYCRECHLFKIHGYKKNKE